MQNKQQSPPSSTKSCFSSCRKAHRGSKNKVALREEYKYTESLQKVSCLLKHLNKNGFQLMLCTGGLYAVASACKHTHCSDIVFFFNDAAGTLKNNLRSSPCSFCVYVRERIEKLLLETNARVIYELLSWRKINQQPPCALNADGGNVHRREIIDGCDKIDDRKKHAVCMCTTQKSACMVGCCRRCYTFYCTGGQLRVRFCIRAQHNTGVTNKKARGA